MADLLSIVNEPRPINKEVLQHLCITHNFWEHIRVTQNDFQKLDAGH